MTASTALKTAILSALVLLGAWWSSRGGAEEPATAMPEPHGLEFVRIEAGRFTMGADLDPGRITAERAVFIQDELPAREVTLTRPFEMSRYEVTNGRPGSRGATRHCHGTRARRGPSGACSATCGAAAGAT